jgi:hypothetical protein
MTERELKPREIAVVEAMREHDAHGHGELMVLTTPEHVTLKNGKITRFRKKIPIDTNRSPC